jgi:flagellar basal-body rod protein FlgB
MDLNNLTLYSMMGRNIKFLSARQQVLATNVANVNTPDFVAQDLQRPDFSRELRKRSALLTTTNDRHFAAVPSRMPNARFTPRPITALTLDGNGVSIEHQLNEVSKTSGEYDRMFTILNKYNQLMQLANTKLT